MHELDPPEGKMDCREVLKKYMLLAPYESKHVVAAFNALKSAGTSPERAFPNEGGLRELYAGFLRDTKGMLPVSYKYPDEFWEKRH